MRYVAIVASVIGTVLFGLLILASKWFVIPFAVCAVLAGYVGARAAGLW